MAGQLSRGGLVGQMTPDLQIFVGGNVNNAAASGIWKSLAALKHCSAGAREGYYGESCGSGPRGLSHVQHILGFRARSNAGIDSTKQSSRSIAFRKGNITR